MSTPEQNGASASLPPPPPSTRSLSVVLRDALSKGDELRLLVAKALADTTQDVDAYVNVEIEGVAMTVPKLAGAIGAVSPSSQGVPVYVLASDDFLLAVGSVGGNPSAAAPYVPIGSAIPYGGVSAPAGYVLGDGGFYSKTTYAALYAVYGTRYGDGGATFGVPDLRKRVPVGAGSGLGLGANDGQAEGSRSVSHHHRLNAGTDVQGSHTHPNAGQHQHYADGAANFALSQGGIAALGSGGSNRNLVSGNVDRLLADGDHGHPAAGAHSHTVNADTSGGGAQDAPSYAVLNFIIRAL